MSPKSVRRSVPFPDPVTGPWSVDIELGVVSGKVECVGVCIKPLGDEAVEPLTTRLLRKLALGALVEEVRVEADDDVLDLVDLELPEKLGVLGDAGVGPLSTGRKRRGPKGKPRSHYEAVARVYLSRSKAPTKGVSEEFGVSHSTATKWVRKARSLGLIPPTTRGRASSQSTDN